MASENNERKTTASRAVTENDLDLDDIGVVLGRKTFDLDPRSLPMVILAIITAGVGYLVIKNVAQTLTAFVIALLFALALDPVVTKVQYLSFDHFPTWRRFDKDDKLVQRIGRYQSVVMVLAPFVLFATIGAYLIAPKVVDQVQNFSREIPQTVKGLGKLPIVGDEIGSQKSQDNIKHALRELPKRLSAKNSPLSKIFRSVVDGAYLGFLFLLMFVTLLLDGPRLVRNTRRLIPPDRRTTADRIARATHRVIGQYMAGSVFVATLAGVVITSAALILGVPLAPLLGVWIVATNMIPQIGGLLGGVPFVLFGFTVSPLTGLICLVIFVSYQQIENHIIQPLVVGKTVKISPPVTMVAALIGVAAGGVLGAMLAVPTVGAVKALAAEFDFPRGEKEKMIASTQHKPKRTSKKSRKEEASKTSE